jgi:hypothetical protein
MDQHAGGGDHPRKVVDSSQSLSLCDVQASWAFTGEFLLWREADVHSENVELTIGPWIAPRFTLLRVSAVIVATDATRHHKWLVAQQGNGRGAIEEADGAGAGAFLAGTPRPRE